MTMIVIGVVSGALLIGASWGIYGNLSKSLEGFLVALAGGALIISAVLELIEPATEQTNQWYVFGAVFVGAAVFTLLDYLVKERWGGGSGAGLLAALTLDGIPENLALGVALIGTGALEVAALSGSIFLSNLPEAAGSAREMAQGGRSKGKVIGLWLATALLLSAAALAGNFLLQDVGKIILAMIRAFAAGAVIASLATEVFPKAFREDSYWAGIATTIGFIVALFLNHLG